MSKIVLFFCCLFSFQYISAQSLIINGNIVINENSSEGAKVMIAKNGNKIDEQSISKKGRFDLKLSFGADYKITFEKTGYVSKIVSINTEIPEEILESNPNFPPVKLMITLLPSVQGVDLSVFDQPIAILAYSQEIDDFTFDKDYSEKIKTRVAQTEQLIKRTLSSRSAAVIEQERKLAELIHKGQQAFDRKSWSEAIGFWTQALTMKTDNKEIKQKIDSARKEAELEEARRSIELQNERAYKLLLSSADSLLGLEKYTEAKEKYTEAIKINAKDNYPVSKIREIDSILATLAKKEADQQKQLAANENAYQKTIATADQYFTTKVYEKAIISYRQALEIKAQETYPKEMITKAEKALADIQKQQAADAEKKRLEEERINSLKDKYAALIAEADAGFQAENYSLAKIRYTEADALNLGEEYPKKQLAAINNIINSSKYKAKLAEYNKNKTLAEKNMQQKNYAGAKVYYQKALSILSIDKETIDKQIIEIDRLIESARLAELNKKYQENINKADKAYQEKAYAVARFYYKKALEIKPDDKYATEHLQEVEKNIGERQTKEAEL